ncbi:MAG: trypsin-like peptidase domain-containing protein, partial [Clostridia bacterium]|nr:trypsin-like peptidase domain-containing protein [Clostridia bacterium]
MALVVAGCLLVSGGAGFGGAMAANEIYDGGDSSGAVAAQVQPTNYDLATATKSDLSIQEVIALAANSVVEITTEQVVNDSWMQQYVSEGAGSGVIISADGYIVTNNHVISGASKISVKLKNGKTYDAEVVGADTQTDVAVIKINESKLTAAVFGDSDKLQVGDLAVAIGNPLGQLGGTATEGIISALDRTLTIEGRQMTLLQTSASVNPGNSGGGLFNGKGQLIGMVVAKSAGSNVEGLGFAIPVNNVKTVANQL